MSFDPLLAVLGLTALASPTVPTTFDPTAYRGAVAITPAALPSNPTPGTLAIDSGAGFALKWWDGSGWLSASGAGGSGVATQLTYWTGASAISGNNGLVVDSTNRRIGISDSATLFVPLASLHLSKNTNTGMRADTYSNTAAATAGIQFYKARGTAAAPAAVQTDDVLGFAGAYGYGATGFSNQSRSKIEFKAANTWTDLSQGASLSLWTTAIGAVAATERVRLYADGGLQIGGTNATWGTSPGNGVLTVMQNQYIAPLTGAIIQAVGSNNVKARIEIVAFNTSGSGAFATFTGRTSRGNAANPQPVQLDDVIVGLSACGYGATAWPTTNKGLIHILAAENWTDAAQGTYISFDTTAPGGLTTSEKMRIWGNGGVSVGTNVAIAAAPAAGVLSVSGAGTPAVLAGIKLQSFDQVNTYIQNNIQNLSNGAAASCDWVATSDAGTDTTNFVDMGINGSGWATGTWTINGANDGYLYTGSTGLAVGTGAAGQTLKLFTGGTLLTNVRMAFTDTTIQTTPGGATSGVVIAWELRPGPHTTLTASNESSDAVFNFTRQVQFSTGALSVQRAAAFLPPTYAFVGASTLSDAATVAIAGAPVAGTNATITRSSALWIQSGVVRVQNAATQDGILLQGRAGGTSNFYTTIIPGTLTASNTLTTPVTGGTLTTGSGTANQVATWSGTNALTGAATLTLTSTSGASLLANAAGTSTATSAVTAGLTQSITYTGIATTDKSSVRGTATFTTANVNTAAAVLGAGIFSTVMNMPLTNATVVGTQSLMTATPSGAVGAINFYGALNQAIVASAANVFFASASLVGSQIQATFNTANTSGAAVAAAVVGAKIIPSVVTTNASGTNTLANVYGLWIAPGTFSSTGGGGLTIATYYGLLIDTLTLTTMTVTTRYGLYQNDAAATNSFLGLVITSASTTTRAGLRVTHGAAPSAPADGDLWSVSTTGWFVRTNGVTQRVSTGLGVPAAEGADRALTDADNGKNLICTGSRTFTVNTGLFSGFGCSFKGTVAFTGTATITDVRTTGAANPWCALCATGTDTYDIVGSKA